MIKASITLLLTLFLCAAATAQQPQCKAPAETCEGPVYKGREVSHRATFFSRPHPDLTDEARANHVRGRIMLSAVLCRTGQVTDIQVIEGLPFGMTKQAIEATRRAKFTPAEKDGQTVSQVTRFEYRFSYIGGRRQLAQGPLAGRMIESVEIGGYREEQEDQIWTRLKTRGGEPYNKEHIEQDWQMLLALGDFDKEASAVRIEVGVRGDLAVVFELKHLPKH